MAGSGFAPKLKKAACGLCLRNGAQHTDRGALIFVLIAIYRLVADPGASIAGLETYFSLDLGE